MPEHESPENDTKFTSIELPTPLLDQEQTPGELIGTGSQFKVYDLGNERVRKVPTSTAEMMETVATWRSEPDPAEDANIVEKLREDRDASTAYVQALTNEHPEAGLLFGNPTFNPDGSHDQDKLTPVVDVFDDLADEERQELLYQSAAAIQKLWEVGCSDKVFNLINNNALNDEGNVVIADFAELELNKDGVQRLLDQKRWTLAYDFNHHLSPTERGFVMGAMRALLNRDTLDQHWGKQLKTPTA